MRSAPSWIRRGFLLALVTAVAVAVARALSSGRPADRLVPAIGGDTWPPVPVKDTRPT